MARSKRRAETPLETTELRIIGGSFRGRKLRYEPFRAGDNRVTRPMKHRVREAIFNLVGTAAEGRHAIDLFAGTGALGLEALSRGAAHATFIEKHVPTARVIEENIKAGVRATTNSGHAPPERSSPSRIHSCIDDPPGVRCPHPGVARRQRVP